MKPTHLKLPSNKDFGILFTSIFFFITIYFLIQEKPLLFYIFTSLFSIFLIVTIFRPSLLKPLNKLWMMFGYLMGRIMNPLIMGVIFFLMITPIAIVTRFFKRDELVIKKKDRRSMWNTRLENQIKPESFNNQF
jgi:hypothetical protein